MAPLRYRPAGPVTRSNQPASKRPTRQNLVKPKTSINPECKTSHNEQHNEPEFEPDLNELYIQSIEELLPEKEHNAGKSATPVPHSSLERSPITPGTPIKVERVSDSLIDIYDTSPRGHVYKTADHRRRQTSRSTAQLTTPASSPERKCERRYLIGEAPMVKLEVNHESNGRQSFFDSSSTPPTSSPERNNLSKGPGSKVLPTMPQQTPSRALLATANTQDIRQSSSRTETHLHTAILSQKPTLERHSGLQKTPVSCQQPYALTTKVSKPQKDCEKPVTHTSLGRKARTDYPPILPSPKVRLSTSKITTPPGPIRTVSKLHSTPAGSPTARGDTTEGKICCKLMCLQCTPEEVFQEYGLGPRENRPNIPRLKSMSACPSSVSSFGPDDDIPHSNKLHREVGRAVTESTKTFASNRMLEISPSLRPSDLLAHLGINRPSSIDNVGRNDVYDDFEADSLPQKDPRRVIFGKVWKFVGNHGQRNVNGTQRSHIIEDDIEKGEKTLRQISGRSLRSVSAATNISKKLQSFDQQTSQKDEDDSENEPNNDAIGNEDRGEDENSSSEYEERASRNAPSQASLKVRRGGNSIKRTREAIDDWQPTFSDDEDMVNGDDIVEIDRNVFELSKNRRKKRHKSKSQDTNRNPDPRSPIPKEEEELTGNEVISMPAQGSGATKGIDKNNMDNTDQEKTPCDYYMNTYWEHGRARDGRRARDAFVSYADFKKYCGKNNQPTDNRCLLLFKKDLKHYLLCEHHASLRQDLFRAAWNFEHNPGFSFKSCSKDEATRRSQNEAIGNTASPRSSSRGSTGVADGEIAEIIGEVLKVIGTSHTADVAQLTKSKKKLESEVKGLKRQLARIRKR